MTRTSIAVDSETRDVLYYQKEPTESYDDYLRRVFNIASDDGEQVPVSADE